MFRDTIMIGARCFRIERLVTDPVLEENEDAMSYIDHSASRIVIRDVPSLSQDAYDEFVVHEILHAIVKNAGLDQCLKDGFDEEFLVSALAPRIHDLLNEMRSML